VGWNDIKMPSSGGDILKLESGKAYRIRIVGEPYVYGSEFEGKPSTRYAMAVWNETDSIPNILMLPPGAFSDVLGYAMNEEDWGDPEKYDFVIKKTGTGVETRYAVQPSPKKNDLDKDKRDQVEKINLEEVLSRLPSVTFYAKASDAESGVTKTKVQPTQTQDEVIEPGDDPINLNDIPF
jgi:hypothetical protein